MRGYLQFASRPSRAGRAAPGCAVAAKREPSAEQADAGVHARLRACRPERDDERADEREERRGSTALALGRDVLGTRRERRRVHLTQARVRGAFLGRSCVFRRPGIPRFRPGMGPVTHPNPALTTPKLRPTPPTSSSYT